jgi:hypothetical protein
MGVALNRLGGDMKIPGWLTGQRQGKAIPDDGLFGGKGLVNEDSERSGQGGFRGVKEFAGSKVEETFDFRRGGYDLPATVDHEDARREAIAE